MSDNHKIPKLNANNYDVWKLRYDVWKLRMKAYLVTKGLWGVIDGSQIFAVDAAGVALKAKTDENALSELQLALDDKRLVAVANFRTAKAVWDYLLKEYQGNSLTNTVYLIRDFFTLKMAEGENMDDNIAHIESIFNKLTVAGAGITDLMEAVALLNSCPNSFAPIVSALEVQHLTNPLTYEHVKSTILGEANKRKSNNGVSGGENQALSMYGKKLEA